ncbi:UNVERIFIED_ORG: para-nitrobenzyl esterase [Martelella mediterranea]
MRDSFIAFARSGSPQTDAMPEWPQHNPKTLAYLRFDSKLTVANDFVGEQRRRAWDNVPVDAV